MPGVATPQKKNESVIGKFQIGFDNVELAVNAEHGGEFRTHPQSRITVGLGSSWVDTVDTLLHEVMEYAIDTLCARYSKSNSFSADHSSYLFSMDHVTFSDACARTSMFIVPAIPILKTAWDAYHSPRRAKKR